MITDFFMEKIAIQYYKSSFGDLIIGSNRDYLCLCDWRYRAQRHFIDKKIQHLANAMYILETSVVIEKTIYQIELYVQQKLQSFNIPLILYGTNFQKNVWQALQNIPYGKTTTYLDIAKQINNPKGVRAVANAIGLNAIPIIIPCHRVIGSDGLLTGYASGVEVKQKLLETEC